VSAPGTRCRQPGATGKWTAGYPMQGYDIEAGVGRLVVIEAERVRAIFALFEENGSVLETPEEIKRRGWRLKG
jgi:hypothetical protein